MPLFVSFFWRGFLRQKFTMADFRAGCEAESVALGVRFRIDLDSVKGTTGVEVFRESFMAVEGHEAL